MLIELVVLVSLIVSDDCSTFVVSVGLQRKNMLIGLEDRYMFVGLEDWCMFVGFEEQGMLIVRVGWYMFVVLEEQCMLVVLEEQCMLVVSEVVWVVLFLVNFVYMDFHILIFALDIQVTKDRLIDG